MGPCGQEGVELGQGDTVPFSPALFCLLQLPALLKFSFGFLGLTITRAGSDLPTDHPTRRAELPEMSPQGWETGWGWGPGDLCLWLAGWLAGSLALASLPKEVFSKVPSTCPTFPVGLESSG